VAVNKRARRNEDELYASRSHPPRSLRAATRSIDTGKKAPPLRATLILLGDRGVHLGSFAVSACSERTR